MLLTQKTSPGQDQKKLPFGVGDIVYTHKHSHRFGIRKLEVTQISARWGNRIEIVAKVLDSTNKAGLSSQFYFSPSSLTRNPQTAVKRARQEIEFYRRRIKYRLGKLAEMDQRCQGILDRLV